MSFPEELMADNPDNIQGTMKEAGPDWEAVTPRRWKGDPAVKVAVSGQDEDRPTLVRRALPFLSDTELREVIREAAITLCDRLTAERAR